MISKCLFNFLQSADTRHASDSKFKFCPHLVNNVIGRALHSIGAGNADACN